jgi:sporulation protein YlmC with PRC-barrel domain
MKSIHYSILGLIIISLILVAGNSFAQTLKGVPGAGGVFKSYSEQFGDPFPASAMIWSELKTPDGHYVAEIIDLLIDPANGRVSDVVITHIRGMGSKKVGVPFSSVSRNGANIFIYNAPEDAYRFHGMAPYWSEGSHVYSKHEEPMASYKTSKLIGAMVRTSKGEDLGRIDDLVISTDGQVGDLIVSHMGKRVAVPFRDLSRSGEDAFVLKTLDAAPAY